MLDELEEIKERKLKKVFIISIGAFILIIFLIYIFINAIGSDILAGLISSSETRENELDFSFDGKLIFMNNSLEKLNICKNLLEYKYRNNYSSGIYFYQIYARLEEGRKDFIDWELRV